MPTNASFENELKRLNSRQREAVDQIDGPVMVIAGPGTGKTQILTLRIANILKKTDTEADAILALTFTEAASANMRRRLVSIIGSRGYYVRISTFHGFCNTLIRDYPDKYATIIGSMHALPADTIAIVREIIEHGEYSDLRPFADKFYYVPEIIKSIKDIKQEGFDPESFLTLAEKEKAVYEAREDLRHTSGRYKGEMKLEHRKMLEKLNRNIELASIYAEYQAAMRSRKLYDFDDMILETIKAMENDKDFLLELQEKFQYILVDEHQDTNGAQNRVLELLASFYPNPNLFVVGDEKQAIFRFQGASLDNFLYFKDKFEGVKLINLEENYRSTQTILDSAQSLIENNKARLSGPLRASGAASKKAQAQKPVQVWNFSLPEAELLFLAEEAKRLHAAGIPWNEIAFLYRENRDVIPIADFFASAEIPFAIESDRNLLSNLLITKLVCLLDAVYRFGEDEPLARALHLDFLDINEHDIYRLLNASSTATESDKSLYASISNGERLRALELAAPEKISELYEKLATWKKRSENEELAKFTARLMKESGFLHYAISRGNYADNMEAVSTFFDEVKKMSENHDNCKLRDLIDYIDVLKSHGVSIKERKMKMRDAIRLMTAHKAKGLEFEAVFITSAVDGHWGNKRTHKCFLLPFKTASDVSEFEKNEDERRLFYMALTRAKAFAYITWSQTASDAREQVPCQFIGEIKEDLRETREGGEYEKAFSQKREAFIASPAQYDAPHGPDAGYFAEVFEKRGLSATALNNYISCPWKYFYQNLVRLPQVPNVSQFYGIAAHKALQSFFDARKKSAEANKDFLLEEFKRDMERKPLSRRDKDTLLKKGLESLGGYFDFWNGKWNTNTLNEFRISGVDFNGTKLTGNLDKLEIMPDGESATVVDYKTKQPQSRNWIEGGTKDRQSGDYKRQLVFYKLLLELKPERTYIMKAGAIDFLEPNDRGIYKREDFEILDSELEDLKTAINRIAGEIRTLAFWDKRCDDKDCEFCKLRELMS
jgi:DNA helicase II / ATP-dependent DNA helicase PcrA